MTAREFLETRYAILKDLSARSVVLYHHTLDRFRDFLGREAELADLDDLTVSRFLRWRASTPHRGRLPSPASVVKDRTQLCAIWRLAAEKRLVGEFPSLARKSVPHKIPKAYTLEEMRALLAAASARPGNVGDLPAAWWWRTLLQVAYQTAERIGALQALTWGEVDSRTNSVIFLAATRKGRHRDILRPITPELSAELEQHRGAPGSLVWPWPYEYHYLWTVFRSMAERANVRPLGFHGLRKSAASYLAAAGGDPTRLLDHAKPQTTIRHYIDPTILQEQDSLGLLPRLEPRDN